MYMSTINHDDFEIPMYLLSHSSNVRRLLCDWCTWSDDGLSSHLSVLPNLRELRYEAGMHWWGLESIPLGGFIERLKRRGRGWRS